jgi:hypothetical protein
LSVKRFSPKTYGAIGDGIANDTAAFSRLSEALRNFGGGIVELAPRAVYLVGDQKPSPVDRPLNSFPPTSEYILDLNGCTKPVFVQGNGATLRTAPGMKYGVFNTDGTRMRTTDGYLGFGASTPFFGMIRATGCSGGAHLENLILDGNSANINLGGRYGDYGWQLACSGIQLGHWIGSQNSCAVSIDNVRSINHCLDGLVVFHPGATRSGRVFPVKLTNCDFSNNARQGLSWVGGKGLTARRCKFNNTGRGAWYSPPAAGLDIEPEGGAVCEDGEFIDCEFVNNVGAGAQGYGDPSRHHFAGCTFVGTTGPSVTGFGPSWSFRDCQFTGQLVNVYPSSVAADATRFDDCRLLFGTARSPTGQVYAPGGHMGDFGGRGGRNVIMRSCLLDGEDNPAIRLSYLSELTFIDCELRQSPLAGAGVAQYTTWLGTNKITAAKGIDLYHSVIRGRLQTNAPSRIGMN